MANYKPQHARLLFIDRMIREKRYPNRSSLADEWETSSKTIQRDLDYIRYELDAPIEYSAKQRGYYYTEEQYQLPAIHIRESDLFAIYLADKLTTRLGTGQELFTVLPPFATVILPEILATVFDCLRTSTRLEVEYRKPGGEPAWRRVDPYHGVRFEGDWYIVGHCHLRDIRERQWHPSQRIEERTDGSLLLTITVNHLLELKRWLLSWGDAVRVVLPVSLTEDLRRTARCIAARYDQDQPC